MVRGTKRTTIDISSSSRLCIFVAIGGGRETTRSQTKEQRENNNRERRAQKTVKKKDRKSVARVWGKIEEERDTRREKKK